MLPSPMRALGRRSKDNLPDELHLAVLTGRTKKIKNLVRKGVHIESVNSLGQTPLFCAAYGGDYEVVKVLLRLGANPNRRCGSGGAAPIHAASFRGSRRVLRYLVEAGGDLSLRDAELQSPRDYALKQPAPIRRHKILQFFDLLYAMTLHRMATSTLPQSSSTLPSNSSSYLSDGGSLSGTLKSHKLKKGFFGGSQLSLSRKSSHQSTASVWSSCVSEVSSTTVSQDEIDSSKTKEIVLTPNLHKSVSCHLLDQLCVTTSLPLLSPAQLQRPHTPTPAYTCGGPTVYSSFSWLGTPVTVRRPTPALTFSNQGRIINDGADEDSPDQDAVRSLLHELSFLRRLRHPGFLKVMAACHVTHPSPDHVTLVYQHVPHGSLYHHLHVQHHDLSVGGTVDILIGLVEALLFMHAHGWYHCGLSSHSLHLVSLNSAKLGGFEYAFESQVKGVGMRGEHISKCGWLRPWQAPETVLEKMISIRTEVYSVAAIIWEIWSGMPPWSGVEEDEISKRVAKGESLPPLKGLALSLVSYLTEYGLKWNAHERELDLQEVHTMLRSLRIQCHEEERVPAVTSWGPPSIPNTPVIGRQSAVHPSRPLDSSVTSSSSAEMRSVILTSTPVRSSCSKSDGQKPDLLPNKVTPKAFMTSSFMKSESPDVLPSELKFQASNAALLQSESEENYTFVRNAAKRAFLLTGEQESDGVSSSASSPTSERDKRNRRLDFPMEVVKRGLSLSNICGSALTYPSATVFTRTTSHISLSSTSSGDICGRKPPQRTISQVTLTLRKLSLSSSSSSSVNSSDLQLKSKGTNAASLEQRNKMIKAKTTKESESERSNVKKKEYRYNEIVGIKPASHQLTRHSSSCSLASGPPSPAHSSPTSLFSSSRNSRLANSHDCLATSPKSTTKLQTMPLSPRPLSLFADKGSLLSEAVATNLKASQRRHSESHKRSRRPRRRQEMEFEDEFIDDEFDANLYDQPHMQLSVGSSENLLDNRLSFTLVTDSASSSNLSQHSRHLTSSEDDDDDTTRRVRPTMTSRRPVMKALEETGDSDNADEPTPEAKTVIEKPSPKTVGETSSPKSSPEKEKVLKSGLSQSEGEADEVFWKNLSKGDDAIKDFDVLKSIKATRTLEKDFSNYLPTYSIGSDTEESGEA